MAGRPKMSKEQKAEAKAAREAAKTAAAAGAKGAADRAEASAAKKGSSKPSAAPHVNSDDLDREEQALFLQWMPLIKTARAALDNANSQLRNLYKKAKAEGAFTKADFDTAFALETSEKEARERAKIARQLKIAKMVGSSLGNQLDMFLEPDRTPAAEIAFEEGKRDAMAEKKAIPSYDPSTEQARRYLEGYHSVSEKRVTEGIGKLDPDAAKHAQQQTADKVKADQQRGEDAQAFESGGPPEPAKAADAPQSGTPMTRAQFKARQEAEKAAASK